MFRPDLNDDEWWQNISRGSHGRSSHKRHDNQKNLCYFRGRLKRDLDRALDWTLQHPGTVCARYSSIWVFLSARESRSRRRRWLVPAPAATTMTRLSWFSSWKDPVWGERRGLLRARSSNRWEDDSIVPYTVNKRANSLYSLRLELITRVFRTLDALFPSFFQTPPYDWAIHLSNNKKEKKKGQRKKRERGRRQLAVVVCQRAVPFDT